ncbi:MAG: mechanosensitive ion channel family protein [Bacillota bacterium]
MLQRLLGDVSASALLVTATYAVFRIAVILVLARAALVVANPLLKRALARGAGLEEKRLKTLETLLVSLLQYSVGLAALLAILAVLGIDTTSILAGAGIIGLALGFGAQNLVRDIITGFFIVFEDQFSVGDYVTAGGESGIVEEMGLRVTKIRDFAGNLHVIPNSNITHTANHSRGNMRAMVDVAVAYEEDIERVTHILNQTAGELARTNPAIREGPTVLGLAKLGESEMVFRIIARTEPMAQWAVEREILRAVKLAFDRQGIEIPYPRRVQVPVSATKIGRDSPP